MDHLFRRFRLVAVLPLSTTPRGRPPGRRSSVGMAAVLIAAALLAAPGPAPLHAHGILPPFDPARLQEAEAPDPGAPPDVVYDHLVDVLRGLSPAERALFRLLFRGFYRPNREGTGWADPAALGIGVPGADEPTSAGPDRFAPPPPDEAGPRPVGPGSQGDRPVDGLRAGTSVVDLTPPQGCPLGGTGRWREDLLHHDNELDPHWYSKFFWPPEGVHDPIYAKTLVLDNGERRIVWVGIDAVGFSAHLFRKVTDQLSDLGIPPENYFFTGTHNHSGPGAVNYLPFLWFGAMDVYDPRIALPMVEKLEAGVRAAIDDLEPARLGYATRPDTVGLSRNSRDDPEKVDPTIGVLRVDRADGSPKCVVFNFAAHADALDSEWPWMSADFPGFAESRIEGQLGSGVIAFHVNGAEGDQVPDAHGRSNLEAAQWVGETLADEVVKIWEEIETTTDVEIDLERRLRWMGPAYTTPGLWDTEYPNLPLWLKVPLTGTVEDVAKVTALRLNDLLITTVPGEAIHDVGVKIRDHARLRGYDQVWTFGLTNGYLAYFTTWEEYWQGGYQAAATLFGPWSGWKMVELHKAVIDAVAGRDPAR